MSIQGTGILMGKTVFNLKPTLDRLNVTPNQIAVESKIRPATIYDMYKNKTTRIHMETLTRILDTLNSIAREKGIQEEITVGDIITYSK